MPAVPAAMKEETGGKGVPVFVCNNKAPPGCLVIPLTCRHRGAPRGYLVSSLEGAEEKQPSPTVEASMVLVERGVISGVLWES